MYGKPAITCCKYQVFLYCSMSHHTAPTPHYRHALPPLCMVALPSPIGKRSLVWLNYHTYFKKQRGNLCG
jgi:hypothetical protein